FECFDGDLPEVLALKKVTLSRFEEGVHQYYDHHFAEAKAIFGEILQQHPGDRAAQVFEQLAAQALKEGAILSAG
ncbi:MAG: hypothetical protein EAZ89_01935, partial [Bacteroidetes bacterium]